MNCDPIAGWYRWAEGCVFGSALQRCRTHFLPNITDSRRALLLGDGDGRFLKALLAAHPDICVDSVELSGKMLESARHATAPSDRVRYLHADARSIELPAREYDLIVTHFFLDCFDRQELERLVPRIARAAKSDAVWVVSEFRLPDHGWVAWAGGGLIAIMYRFFRVTTGLRTDRLADHRPLLAASGYRLRQQQPHWRGLLASELWELR